MQLGSATICAGDQSFTAGPPSALASCTPGLSPRRTLH